MVDGYFYSVGPGWWGDEIVYIVEIVLGSWEEVVPDSVEGLAFGWKAEPVWQFVEEATSLSPLTQAVLGQIYAFKAVDYEI